MYDMYEGSNCGCSPRPDHDDKRERACDIESECCDTFVKEQFTIRATASSNEITVYKANTNTITRATIKIINLSPNVSVTVGTNGLGTVVGPNQEAAITVNGIDHLTLQTGGGTARVLLCFDLQVADLD
ncbi:S-Ena type endospore appendage [Clostridium sp. CCUG 7971]|uniref:S-Ena type endospore appendage n=1 Tax=Clostridium sp. CCUG 7971 TaxID=2811414 RepID=UPI001ABBE022|nr:S-Ena type endospore appendage [Clostridium sp. CCUG 7971]MBO3444478.1 hypothetical protein [Clostridium sp. CCUG 7971]